MVYRYIMQNIYSLHFIFNQPQRKWGHCSTLFVASKEQGSFQSQRVPLPVSSAFIRLQIAILCHIKSWSRPRGQCFQGKNHQTLLKARLHDGMYMLTHLKHRCIDSVLGSAFCSKYLFCTNDVMNEGDRAHLKIVIYDALFHVMINCDHVCTTCSLGSNITINTIWVVLATLRQYMFMFTMHVCHARLDNSNSWHKQLYLCFKQKCTSRHSRM
jgi:hypothetical protein